ncbi:glycosyltransferase-like domain-containing protein 1 isoform X3 [Cyclopterus lumpus]|uniref:glycosyltransferase-like domain-containing protein 1 isoform X3 n=1 Tax=Cyclopterus lumpus TaxID=8103 RepID=UPI001485F788|nr:glycosyltransferase-like domain-containing protein 1 isoform X3 [Cyclopterus lumpus]
MDSGLITFSLSWFVAAELTFHNNSFPISGNEERDQLFVLNLHMRMNVSILRSQRNELHAIWGPPGGPAPQGPSVLLVEPFYGGSHKQLIDLLQQNIHGCCVFTLPAKKWHWRARTAALHFSQTIPTCPSYRVLFSSSVLNLCELVALRPDLAHLKKVLYFHENQLVYPVRKDQERDFQYGYNQVLSCLVSDVVVFNSVFNMDSFLSSISSFMKKIPDHRPRDLDLLIRPKCVVLYYPVQFPDVSRCGEFPSSGDEQEDPHESSCEPRTDQRPVSEGDTGDQMKPLHIVWPHRWEHDKNPELFFSTLIKLKEKQVDFHLSVLGETFTEVPEIFSEARSQLHRHIQNWGYLSRDRYLQVLLQADVVVSTARHEFFGVAMCPLQRPGGNLQVWTLRTGSL